VLVTIVILMIGLLGLAGLQSRALTAQMEAYQRSQALILLKDMANRINANRKAVACYAITPVGTGAPYFGVDSTLPIPAVATCAASIQVIYPTLPAATATAAATIAAADMNSWHGLLLGAAETQGGASVGAMIGARGCIYEITALTPGVPGAYMVAVVWQGLNSTAVPAIDCGEGEYGDEAKRRVVTLPISIADLN